VGFLGPAAVGRMYQAVHHALAGQQSDWATPAWSVLCCRGGRGGGGGRGGRGRGRGTPAASGVAGGGVSGRGGGGGKKARAPRRDGVTDKSALAKEWEKVRFLASLLRHQCWMQASQAGPPAWSRLAALPQSLP
jgi:hypothetical protein